ncbi:S8 family peptidase [Streptomyces orinoci]|uniref:S8 family peptidase n=1 Tax=Streptomyces orinoci TaxID=67339 RepID=A0ABV3JWY5_STRON|nr:S8 family peptidase [Streptomyces orinoci]
MKAPKLTVFAALLLAIAAAAALPAAADGTPEHPAGGEAALAPLYRTQGKAVPGHYIVRLRQGSSARVLTLQLGVTPDAVYSHALSGFAATLTPAQLETVRRSPEVEAVEEDAVFTASTASTGPMAARVPAASWGLDRIDQRALPLDGQFKVNGTGEGVTAFIVDTGIDYANSEFGGRARPGVDLVTPGGDGRDCASGTGHGTHVAGIVGGATYGVARKVSLVSVRVLDCAGTTSTARLDQGLDWVAGNFTAPAVLNASLNGPVSATTNNAIDNLADRGVVPVVSAGNAAPGSRPTDACQNSPGSAKQAVVVGATDKQDQMTDFSNWGPCVRLLAPGQDIISARPGGGPATKSGTSQAAPHVTGVAALYRAKNPSATSAAVAGWLDEQSTQGMLAKAAAGTPNKLLYTGGL